VTVNGSTIRQDRDANQRFYGKPLDTKQIIFGPAPGSPAPVGVWMQALQKHAQ
jgi:lipid-binding SYLF domain-containing protein